MKDTQPVRSSDRHKLNEFIGATYPHIEEVHHNSDRNQAWTDTWTHWRTNDINAKTHMTRQKLSMLIQGKQEFGKLKIQCNVYDIISSYKEQIPCIDDIFMITFDQHD